MGGHGGAIRGPLGSQPVARLFLDQELDQRQPLVLVIRLEQQPVIAVIVEAKILFTHATPPQLRHTPGWIVSQRDQTSKHDPAWNRLCAAISCELPEPPR